MPTKPPMYTQFRHKAQEAIAFLKQEQRGIAVAALFHPEIGDIDLAWGETSENERAKGSGLAKIVKWHPEVMLDLQGFISGLHKHQDHRKKGEVHLTDGKLARAGIKLAWNGSSSNWLVTAHIKPKKVSASKSTPAVLDQASGLTTATPENADEQMIGFEEAAVNPAQDFQCGDRAGFTLDGVAHYGTILKITDFGMTIDAPTLSEVSHPAWADVICEPDDAIAPADPVIDSVAEPELQVVESEPLAQAEDPQPPLADADPVPPVAPEDAPTQESPELDSVAHDFKRAEIDAILIQSGFDPGIDYIRANYGDHWCKREADVPVVMDAALPPPVIQQAPDFSPILDGFRQAVADLSNAHASQIAGLTSAMALLADKSSGANEASPPLIASLIAALNEARKPMDINLKLEMPEQKAKRFVAEKDASGRMTLSEVPNS